MKFTIHIFRRTLMRDASKPFGYVLGRLEIMISIDRHLLNDRGATPMEGIEELMPAPGRGRRRPKGVPYS